MRRTHLLCFALVVMLASPAMADSIAPTGMDWNINPSTSPTVLESFTKTVTIDAQVSGDLDILFLFDASTSMGDLLETTATVAEDIILQLSTLYGGGGDTLRMGVSYYQDFADGVFGVPNEVPYAALQGLTTSEALATAGLTALSMPPVTQPGHPSHDAESGLYALYQAATTADWSPTAKRMLVWIGDVPAWDGDIVSAYPSDIGLADTIAALNANNVIVEALSVGALGLDGTQAPYVGAGGLGAGPNQATDIALATGGSVTDLTGTDLDEISGTELLNSILGAIELSLTDYEEVSLDVSVAEALFPGLTIDFVQIDPDMVTDSDNQVYTGDYDRTITRTFRFDVTITVPGSADGDVLTFPIYGTLNGNRIVVEWDNIYVGDRPTPDVPEPSTIALMGLGLLGLGVAARRKLRK